MDGLFKQDIETHTKVGVKKNGQSRAVRLTSPSLCLIGKVCTLARLEKTMHTRRPTYGGYQAALVSSFLMGVALLMFLATSGLDGRQLIPLYSSWSAVETDGSAPGIDGEQIPPVLIEDSQLLEMLRSMDLQDDADGRAAAEEPSREEDSSHWRVVRMKVTAYCPCSKCCGRHSDGITACNHRIRPGDVFVAADKRYRFGTDMIIPGYNSGRPVDVKDRGRLIKGNRLDVFFASHRQAQKWGTKILDVRVRVD
jgi:3D (Asp-Asp-Asp) domain-containing protein